MTIKGSRLRALLTAAALLATPTMMLAADIAVIGGRADEEFWNRVKKGIDDARLVVEANGGSVNYLQLQSYDNLGPDAAQLVRTAISQGADGIVVPNWVPEAEDDGVVGLIVKMDDIGLHLAQRPNSGVRTVGRGLVKGMPVVMNALGAIGTAAMLWVGGGILVHGTHRLGLAWPAQPLEHLAHGVGQVFGPVGGLVAWLVTALGSALIGLVVGGIIVLIVQQIGRMRGAPAH